MLSGGSGIKCMEKIQKVITRVIRKQSGKVMSKESLLVGGITFVKYSVINSLSDEVIYGVSDHPSHLR